MEKDWFYSESNKNRPGWGDAWFYDEFSVNMSGWWKSGSTMSSP